VDEAPSNDPDDRRHIAAALAAGADVIVTNNLADFPSEPLALLGLRVMTADEYLCELFGSARTEVITTIRRLAREKRNPPMTPMDLLARIGKIAPEFLAWPSVISKRPEIHAQMQERHFALRRKKYCRSPRRDPGSSSTSAEPELSQYCEFEFPS
jgi:hypothetical protein